MTYAGLRTATQDYFCSRTATMSAFFLLTVGTPKR